METLTHYAPAEGLPDVVITQRNSTHGGKVLSIPKATAYAYRGRKFERSYKRGVRQAAAGLLGCAVKDVIHSQRLGIYYCLESKAVHETDLGEAQPKRKRIKPSRW